MKFIQNVLLNKILFFSSSLLTMPHGKWNFSLFQSFSRSSFSASRWYHHSKHRQKRRTYTKHSSSSGKWRCEGEREIENWRIFPRFFGRSVCSRISSVVSSSCASSPMYTPHCTISIFTLPYIKCALLLLLACWGWVEYIFLVIVYYFYVHGKINNAHSKSMKAQVRESGRTERRIFHVPKSFKHTAQRTWKNSQGKEHTTSRRQKKKKKLGEWERARESEQVEKMNV